MFDYRAGTTIVSEALFTGANKIGFTLRLFAVALWRFCPKHLRTRVTIRRHFRKIGKESQKSLEKNSPIESSN